MPYKCTVCGKIYLEGSEDLKDVMTSGGCSCGKKFLMYFRGARDIADAVDVSPSPDDSQNLNDLEDVLEGKAQLIKELPDGVSGEKKRSLKWLDREFMKMREEGKPLHLGIETIRILEEGKYEIDVGSLMSGKPIIVQTEEGVYYIDLGHAMRKK